jgi:hypothetical protein
MSNVLTIMYDTKYSYMHEYLTILPFRGVFQSMGITAYDLTVDMLDMHADKRTFHRSGCSIYIIHSIRIYISLLILSGSTTSTPSTTQ